jgi:hypothetical protein
MKIAVRHNLQVYDPVDPSLREDAAFALPMREPEDAMMGETVSGFLTRVEWIFDLPTVCKINGECYGRDEWQARALAVNDNIEFVSRPLGSGGGSTAKTIVSIVALVALTAVAGPAGGALAGALQLPGLATALSAVIVGAGTLAISHFLKPKAGGKTASTDALYNFGLQGNQARAMQPIPVLNGRVKFAPDLAAPTYSDALGETLSEFGDLYDGAARLCSAERGSRAHRRASSWSRWRNPRVHAKGQDPGTSAGDNLGAWRKGFHRAFCGSDDAAFPVLR